MTVKVEFDDRKLRKIMAYKEEQFLRSLGNIAVQNARALAPKDSGQLSNSIIYALDTGERGEFGNSGVQPPNDARVSKPPARKFNRVIRIGSALIYTARQEKFNKTASGFLAATIDFVTSRYKRLAKEVLRI